MNYGDVVQFASRNGKSGIFWQQDLAKESNRKLGYRNRLQRFSVRKHPRNLDKFPPEEPNILQAKRHTISEVTEEKPIRLGNKFIDRNRQKVGSKPQDKKEAEKTLTLTHDQLNAVLVSVGKLATGKESRLKIGIRNNEITIESPRKVEQGSEDEEIEEKADKEKPEKGESPREVQLKGKEKWDRRRETEEDSIYAFVPESRGTTRGKNILGDSRKSKSEARQNRKYSEEDSDLDDQVRDRRKYKIDLRETEVSKTRRETRQDSREQYSQQDNKKGRTKEKRDGNHRKRKDEESDDDRISPRYLDRKSKSVTTTEKKSESTTIERKAQSPTIPEGKGETSRARKHLTPRDIVGIPAALPWKHMTVAERKRLMIVQAKLADQAEKKDKVVLSEQHRQETTGSYAHRQVRETSPELQRNTRVVSYGYSTSPPEGHLPVLQGHMSLAERKRLQWEKERSESFADKFISPWGRPGAGASLRTRSGNVRADYRSRQTTKAIVNGRLMYTY